MQTTLDSGRVPLLQARGLTKTFGPVTACDAIDLTIAPGEIHALLGENGAGKSTFVKMLFGALEPTAGTIVWQGSNVTIDNPAAARKLGIGMVFQHFSLFDALTAAENILLSLDTDEPPSSVAERAREVSQAYGLPLDPYAHVGDLSVGERQRIEIVRCLLQNPQLVILDEPTSVLTPQEADRLFETLERLRGEGRSILYISHRLEEVKRICDSATVLRQGRVVAHCDPKQETAASLARLMVGDEVEGARRQPQPATGDRRPLLEVRGLNRPAAHPFAVTLHDINLTVRENEVLGIAGVAGNGQGELFEAISGEATQAETATVSLCGRDAGHMDISRRRKLGAAFVPEERLGHAAAPDLPLSLNLLLSRHQTDGSNYVGAGGFIRNSALARAAAGSARPWMCARAPPIQPRPRCPAAISRNSSSVASLTARLRSLW